MPSAQLHTLLGHIRRLPDQEGSRTMHDRVFLERFIEARDEGAFARRRIQSRRPQNLDRERR